MLRFLPIPILTLIPLIAQDREIEIEFRIYTRP